MKEHSEGTVVKENSGGMVMERIVICITSLILAAAGTVNAEPALSDVLNNIYGIGKWEPYDAPDELWQYLSGQIGGDAGAQAKFASSDQNFGFIPGVSGGSFQSLFGVTSNGYFGGSPSATLTEAQTGSIFRFADDPTDYALWTSQVSDNGDNKDHMKTFVVTGGSSTGNYVLAWEDLPACQSDWDYQDLVVEVSGVQPIPEPASILLLGLGCLTLIKKRRG